MNEAQLRTHAQHIAPPVGGDQVVHGDEALIGNRRIDIPHVAPQAGKLQVCRVLLAVVRADRVRDRVVGVAEAD